MAFYAGCRTVELHDAVGEVSFPMVVMYPTLAPEKPERLGPYMQEFALDAAPAPGCHPMVLISHGTGGSPLVYRDLARHLARHGFMVGLPEHPFNNRNNDSLAHTVQNLINRPRHLRVAADWFFADASFAALLKPDAFAVIGHSMGGYTALALVGGVPTSVPYESPDHLPHKLVLPPDARVKALVLLAPAAAWYREPGSLSGVRVPIFMLVGDKDEYTPDGFHARLVREGVAGPLQERLIENAGHFAFLTPFPEAMSNPAFPPSQDPPGFDRAAFQVEMNAEVLGFLQAIV